MFYVLKMIKPCTIKYSKLTDLGDFIGIEDLPPR
jgi:hypothetical protein